MLDDPNCINVINQRCNDCRDGYFVLNDGTCAELPRNCEIGDRSTARCRTCSNNFDLIDGVCVELVVQIDNCLRVSQSGDCLEC